jgi:hypothetical protein
VPSVPKSHNLELSVSRGRAHKDEDFLIYDEIYAKLDRGLVIFSKRSLVDMFCLCNVIMVDKTWETRPMMFFQVYVVMGKIEIALINDYCSYLVDMVSYTKRCSTMHLP